MFNGLRLRNLLGLNNGVAANESTNLSLNRSLLERLVIVDDSIITYNTYKNNTIRVRQWTNNVKNDRELMTCLEIIKQLTSHPQTNVYKDLQYILDM